MPHDTPADELSLGELKARWREEHLCLKCEHHLVCAMAKAVDANLLVTITRCLALGMAETRDERDHD